MKIIKGLDEMEKFIGKNKKRMGQVHFRPITMEELRGRRKVGMTEIRKFCESMRIVHETHLEIDPLKEIKEKKIALFWCYTFDRDILEEVRMYELEIGIEIVLIVEILPEEYDSMIEKKADTIIETWKPMERDIVWLKGVVNRLNVGGHWSAPMGFIFEKTGENELTLRDVRNNESLIAIYQTIKVGERADINIVTEMLKME